MKKIKARMMIALMLGMSMISFTPMTYAAPWMNTVQSKQDHRSIILRTQQLAVQGKALNSENFAIGSKGEDIQRKWGKPDPESSSPDAYTYSKRNIQFFLSSNMVTHIISFDKRYESITYREVKKTLGEPAKETRGDDGVYTTYECGKKLLVLSYYYDSTGKNPDTINQVVVMNQYKDLTEEEKHRYRLKWPSLFP